jgi:hypothetical protein
MCIYSTISREAPSDILQNSSVTRKAGCETLQLIKRINSVPIYSSNIFPSMTRSYNRSLPLMFSTCSMHAMFTLIYVIRIQFNLTQECMCGSLFILFCFLWRCDPTRVMASSFLKFLNHTQRRTTVGRTPLEEWSARRRQLTTHNTHNRQISMPPVGFEPTISAGERPQNYAVDRAATGTGPYLYWARKK